jgi:hypothetical protein
MMYVGEFLSSKTLNTLNRLLVSLAAIVALAAAGLGVSAFLERTKVSSMKEEITNKSKAIVEAQTQAKLEKEKPAAEKLPSGLAAVSAFQTKLNRLTASHGCSLTQFQASDQMNPYISTFQAAAQAAGTWTQVEVKMNLMGGTGAVIGTLKDLDTMGIPYEFTSLEMSRTQASDMGEATVSANVSLRVLTIPGGA